MSLLEKVIHHQGDLGMLKTSVAPAFSNSLIAHRAGNIVAQHQIEIGFNELAACTQSNPACAAKIFCVIVIPILTTSQKDKIQAACQTRSVGKHRAGRSGQSRVSHIV